MKLRSLIYIPFIPHSQWFLNYIRFSYKWLVSRPSIIFTDLCVYIDANAILLISVILKHILVSGKTSFKCSINIFKKSNIFLTFINFGRACQVLHLKSYWNFFLGLHSIYKLYWKWNTNVRMVTFEILNLSIKFMFSHLCKSFISFNKMPTISLYIYC